MDGTPEVGAGAGDHPRQDESVGGKPVARSAAFGATSPIARSVMIERFVPALKEQCTHRHRFDHQQHAMWLIGDWTVFITTGPLRQAPGMKTSAEAYALAS